MRSVIVLMTAALLLGRPALADFVLLNTSGSSTTPEITQRPPAVPVSPIEQVPLPPPGPRFSTARGFGSHVPLSFAVRQIVPPSMGIAYAPEVDGAVRVDWTGGRPWNRVLQDVIAPLGLRMSVAHQTVTIAASRSRETG